MIFQLAANDNTFARFKIFLVDDQGRVDPAPQGVNGEMQREVADIALPVGKREIVGQLEMVIAATQNAAEGVVDTVGEFRVLKLGIFRQAAAPAQCRVVEQIIMIDSVNISACERNDSRAVNTVDPFEVQ